MTFEQADRAASLGDGTRDREPCDSPAHDRDIYVFHRYSRIRALNISLPDELQ
jgi:hypothetical protein